MCISLRITLTIVEVKGLEPMNPRGSRFTVCCNCHYAILPYYYYLMCQRRGELSLRSRNKYITCTPYGIVLSSHSKVSFSCSFNKIKYSHNTKIKLIKCYVLPLGLEPRILTLKGCSFTIQLQENMSSHKDLNLEPTD